MESLIIMQTGNLQDNTVILILFCLVLALIWIFIMVMNKDTNRKYEIIRRELDTLVRKNENIDIVTAKIKSERVNSQKNFKLLYDKSSDIITLNDFLKAISISREEFNRLIDSSKKEEHFEFEYSVKDEGVERFVRAYAHIISNNRVDIILTDITYERIGDITYKIDEGIDPLTGLINRNNYKREIKKLIDDYRFSYGAFLFIDIDEFQTYNKIYGHEFGDEVIKAFAARLKGYSDEKTVVFRFVGDQFGVYRHGFNKRKDMESFFNDIKTRLTINTLINNTEVNITCSIGISILSFDVATEDGLYKYAEFAMQEAKKIRKPSETTLNYFNKNQYEKYKKINKKQLRLQKVIDDRKYYSIFQPIVNLDDMSLYGIEGLTRIKDRTYRSIVDFLDIAKEKGLEDYASMKFGVNVYKDYIRSSFYNKIKIFINVNFSEMNDDDGYRYVAETKNELKNIGVDTDSIDNHTNIVVEFSERTSYNVDEKVENMLNKYRQQNIQIAIDDFGAGYANESLILKMKPDIVKLDKELISNIDKDEYTKTVTTNIITMLKKLGVKIVAEGIETKEEFDFVRALGVDFGQGCYIQKPTKIEEIKLDYSEIIK
ncbi:EAL domain-containing protein [Clostridium sardiniense]|uniref:EAL domain-containing protein n=1 Tax=Clostridium sardiniense TaxID=29369 RepID=UPI003D342BC1